MNKKAALLLCLALGLVAIVVFIFRGPKQSQLLTAGIDGSNVKGQAVPSQTLKTYTDPSGFTFDYPDNLSLTKNETEDANTYADLTLSSKEINGSLILKIVDSKFVSLDEWVKSNKAKEAAKEAKLGNLKALEIKTADRVLLGALDSGVLFTIEMPKIEEDFWGKVYNKVLADFSFTSPTADNAGSSGGVDSSDVSFEGEEVVE